MLKARRQLTTLLYAGVSTKPDSLFIGSKNERDFISLAQNKEIEFRLGWHILKGLDSEKGSFSLTKRQHEEDEFFSKGIWPRLPAQLLGVSKLRDRLSSVFTRQIAPELPSVAEEIASQLRICREELDKMGSAGQPRMSSICILSKSA